MPKIARTFRFEEDLIKRFDAAAAANGVDKTQVITDLIKKYVEGYEMQTPKKFLYQFELLNYLTGKKGFSSYQLERGFDEFEERMNAAGRSLSIEEFTEHNRYDIFEWTDWQGNPVAADIAFVFEEVVDEEFTHYYLVAPYGGESK